MDLVEDVYATPPPALLRQKAALEAELADGWKPGGKAASGH